MHARKRFSVVFILLSATSLFAGVGDPQLGTDHPWYPGELAMSTFERLFATQAALYQRVAGRRVDSDQDKALAAWFWRNTHYCHGEGGRRDFWGDGFSRGKDQRLREYWNGLFAYGFGLCGTTHSQWTAEFEYLLGHGRARGVGAAGHNAFEVLLQDAAYGPDGKWVLLDHDLSTVIFDESGRRLLGLGEIQDDVDRWINRNYKPNKQHGWLVCGLYPGDGNSYRRYAVAEYLPGYAGPPPIVYLRRGERLRRYFDPGLNDGKTYVFWGRNYNTGGIPGPERSRTWVNQPEKMYGSKTGTPHHNGQMRFANVESVYRPNFANGDYREGVVAEGDGFVTFEFRTPYIIGATPPNDDPWGIYAKGCRNGLIVRGDSTCQVSISIDAGRTWHALGPLSNGLDATDWVKGRSQYWLRCETDASRLVESDLEIRTVCQANVAVLPRLKDGGTTVRFEASGKTVQSMGPELDLARTFLSAGAFDDKTVTLTVTPRKSTTQIHAAAHIASGSPPNPKVRYSIDYSLDAGTTWQPIVHDWTIPRRGDEPNDFWSQSFCYGAADITATIGQPISIRFRNDGGKRVLRAEAHLIQQTGPADPVRVTYQWTDTAGAHRESHVFQTQGDWKLKTDQRVHTQWVEMEPAGEPG